MAAENGNDRRLGMPPHLRRHRGGSGHSRRQFQEETRIDGAHEVQPAEPDAVCRPWHGEWLSRDICFFWRGLWRCCCRCLSPPKVYQKQFASRVL